VLRIVLTGPESTGKTTLARELAALYDTPWSAEYAREYASTRASLGLEDVEAIARGQIVNEDRATLAARDLVILDTDLVSTAVYSRFYYATVAEWIARAAAERLGDLYLMPDLEVPFVPDTVRDSADARPALHQSFVDELSRLGARVVRVGGSLNDRRAQARAAIETLRSARYAL
jgi:NadR type nicotinamide-nucleotide adenylyltransferase